MEHIAAHADTLVRRRPRAISTIQLVRGHWGIENRGQDVCDVTYDEDRSQAYTGIGPRTLATCQNLASSALRHRGHTNIAKTIRHTTAATKASEDEAKSSDLWRWTVIDNNPTPKLSPRAELEHRMCSLTMRVVIVDGLRWRDARLRGSRPGTGSPPWRVRIADRGDTWRHVSLRTHTCRYVRTRASTCGPRHTTTGARTSHHIITTTRTPQAVSSDWRNPGPLQPGERRPERRRRLQR